MKKRFFSVIVGAIICFNGLIFAQVSVQPGITAGLSSYTQKFKTMGMTIEPDSKTGFVGGVEFALLALTPFVEFVYYAGLTNVWKNIVEDMTMKKSGWELKAGLRFKL